MTGSRNKTNVFFSVAVLVSFTLTAVAQELSYSADSLIATFGSDLQSPLKGTEIRLSDRVVEVRKSSVTFRSSGKDKVTCELVSPIANLSQGPRLGSPLTVIGKVRGRGLLGNVTLDQCSFAQPAAVANNERIPADTSHQVAELPLQPAELPAQLPLETAPVVVQTPVTAVPTKVKSSALVQPATTAAAAAPVALVADNKLGAVNPAPQVVEEQQAISQCAESPKKIPYGSHLLVALFAGIGTLTLTKLRYATSTRIRTSPGTSSEDVRRAALEALLSKQKK